MYTLAAATRRAQLAAAERGVPVYVVELVNDEPDEVPDSLAALTPQEWLALVEEVAAELREERAHVQLWRVDLEAARAAGLLPSWDNMITPERWPIEADYSDEHDPVTFDTMDEVAVALLVDDLYAVPLVRLAQPDGALVAITDSDAEGARLLVRHASTVARLRQAGRRIRASSS